MKRLCKNESLNKRRNLEMTEERQLVMQAVLEGKLDASHVTMDEIKEVEDIVFELIADKKTPFETWGTLQ